MAPKLRYRPQDTARYTVERNGGSYSTDVVDLLGLFGRRRLTRKARKALTAALADVGVGVEPDLSRVDRRTLINLYLLEEEAIPEPITGPAPAPWAPRRSGWGRLVPQTWKGWAGYAVALLLVIAAASGDPEDSPRTSSPTTTTTPARTAPKPDRDAKARAARREQAKLRRERAKLRREREKTRQARIAVRRERERQQAEQAQAAPPPKPAPSCHPDYGGCLDPNASDYDCEGGSGDGPKYTGQVEVKGDDPFDLDRDNDGSGCD